MLEKRGESRTCGAIAVGTLERSIEAAKYLKKLGGSCGAPSRACRRMTCKDTTASYICGASPFLFLAACFKTWKKCS